MLWNLALIAKSKVAALYFISGMKSIFNRLKYKRVYHLCDFICFEITHLCVSEKLLYFRWHTDCAL